MSEVKSYALVQDSFVINCVLWDGAGDVFADYLTVDNSTLNAALGDAYLDGTLYAMPRDGYEYDFNSAALTWSLTEQGAAKKASDEAIEGMTEAESEYARASDEISQLQEKIDDEDYSADETEATVAALKSQWVAYRKSLRAYLSTGNGLASLPVSPDATSAATE